MCQKDFSIKILKEHIKGNNHFIASVKETIESEEKYLSEVRKRLAKYQNENLQLQDTVNILEKGDS